MRGGRGADNFAISKTGLTMIVPSGAKRGDVVVVFKGARVPYLLLRPIAASAGNTKYTLVGEAYVHGIMQGECFRSTDLHSAARAEPQPGMFCIV